jgi:hypothetical protein
MNIARVIEIDGAPMLLIYSKKHGSHTHNAIDGIDSSGRCVRYEDERMPEERDLHLWLQTKVQEELGVPIVARRWETTSIEIKHELQTADQCI